MNTHRKMTVLITGASSGIGYELAKVFAREGHNLVLVARSQAQLEQFAAQLTAQYHTRVEVLPKDLSLATAAQEIFDELQRDSIQIDCLVNNAGYTVYGLFHETDLIKEMQMIQVNLTTPTQLTKLFGREMVKRGFGKILNVGSTGSYIPGPLDAVYCATKAYLLSFSEALWKELEHTGVTITALCPGATSTGFQKAGQVEGVRLLNFGVLSAATVAEAGYRGLMTGKRVVIPSRYNRLQVLAAVVLPRSIMLTLAKNAMERPGSH